jgi:dipeptidyl aminopeptidase/acylaminoacyl peptidase
MRKVFIFTGIIIAGFIGFIYLKQEKIISPLGKGKVSGQKKLAKYSYTALQKTAFNGGKIVIDKIIKDETDFDSYLFYFYVNEKKISGLMNIPKKPSNYPVIIMIRGYVDKEIYEPGVGTSHGGEYLAQNGFITLAPDFLGYGYSDKAPIDAIEDRLLTYVSVRELISSVKNLNNAFEDKALDVRYDGTHLGIWGHSNGGQIALSVMEITGAKYPTVLWAPVSKPFPYSILYYTDDIDDHGKALRKLVANFEKDYDSEKYSLTNYLDWIKAPLQIHQGGADEAVPQKWSDDLVQILKEKEKDAEYFIYTGDDHNFSKGSWTQVMQRTMEFYKKKFL